MPMALREEAIPHLRRYEKVVVESHPAFVGEAIWRFRDAIQPAKLQVAIGLETAHPQALLELNKGFSVDEFAAAAGELSANGVELRSFLLVRPPFVAPEAGLNWVKRSIDFSFEAGASVVSLILTRLGNGAMDALAKSGAFSVPTMAELESSLAYGLKLKRGIVLADLWGLDRFQSSVPQYEESLKRMASMNLTQRLDESVSLNQGRRSDNSPAS